MVIRSAPNVLASLKNIEDFSTKNSNKRISTSYSVSTLPAHMSNQRPIGKDSVLVVDNGSRFIKAGIAGEQVPRTLLPTILSSKANETYIG